MLITYTSLTLARTFLASLTVSRREKDSQPARQLDSHRGNSSTLTRQESQLSSSKPHQRQSSSLLTHFMSLISSTDLPMCTSLIHPHGRPSTVSLDIFRLSDNIFSFPRFIRLSATYHHYPSPTGLSFLTGAPDTDRSCQLKTRLINFHFVSHFQHVDNTRSRKHFHLLPLQRAPQRVIEFVAVATECVRKI